jgi:hypothetical protein
MPRERSIAWSVWSLNQPVYRHAAHSKIGCDTLDGLASRVARANGIPAGNPPIACFQFELFRAADWRRWQCWRDTRLRVRIRSNDDVLHSPAAAAEHLVKCRVGNGREM